MLEKEVNLMSKYYGDPFAEKIRYEEAVVYFPGSDAGAARGGRRFGDCV